ncbi:MAG: MMPL family transporter [Bacteroidales bacterium]|nr:MMPL family transporter [Bacteroidales bacterium]
MKRIMNFTVKQPVLVLAILLGITVFFFMEMKENTRMETDLDEYMPQDHPAFVYSDTAEAIFNIKDGVIFAIENENGIYNQQTLGKVKSLTRELQKLEKINKDDVNSLYIADNIIGTADGLEVESFYEDVPEKEEEIKKIQKRVQDNDMVYERIVSEDETVTIVVAEIEDDVFTQEFYQQLLDIADSYEDENHSLYVAGTPIVEGTMAYLAPRDMQKMVPIVILVIIIVLYVTLRNVKTTVLTLLVVLFSTIWAFGLMATLSVPIYAVTTMVPVMLIAIGVADGIHLFSHMKLFQKEHPNASKKESTVDMFKNMWKPVTMTSVTTSVGFISLLSSEVYPIKYFGLFTAFGVMTAMLFSLVFIPAGIMVFNKPRFPKSKTEGQKKKHPWADTWTGKVLNSKKTVFAITGIVLILSIYGLSRVWINSSFLDKFEEDSDIVQTDNFINKKFGGTTTLNVILEAERNDAFKEPDVLKVMDKMQQEVESELKVAGNSFSLADYIKRMNKVMHADQEEYNKIPDSQNLIAQYLLLYEMSGDPDNLWKEVTYDYNQANLKYQVKEDDSKSLKAAISEIEAFEDDFHELGIEINYAGSGYKALVFTDLILEGQIKSLIISIILIVILLTFMFRQVSIGIIGAVPITITALLSFGIMGLLNIPLDTTTALLASIAVGIGIDYAVHFIERYKIYLRQYSSKFEAAAHTINHSGRAILFNAVVVIAGFLVLLFSVFPPNRALGALVSFNMFTAFLGTMTIMLILLHWKKKFK